MKRIVLAMAIFVLIILASKSNYGLSQDTSELGRSLFSESISLLNRTGGIASFDMPPEGEPFNGLEPQSLEPEQVKSILDEVIKNLRKVIEISPDIKEAYYFLGVAYARKMDTDEAISAFFKSLEVEPDRQMTYIIVSGLLWDAKRYDDALDISSKFKKQFPESRVVGFFLLGNTYFQMGDFQKSLENGLKIVNLDASSLEGRILLASSYYCLGNLKAADEQFRKLQSDPIAMEDIAALKNDLKERCGKEGISH